MAAIEIIGSETTFSTAPGRQGKVDRLVVYRTDDGLTRFTVVPDEGYTLQVAEAAVRKAEAERRLATPHRFTV